MNESDPTASPCGDDSEYAGIDAVSGRIDETVFLRILYEFSSTLIRINTLDELVWHVVRQVVGKLGFEDCVIYQLDKEVNLLVQTAAIGEKNPEANVIVNRLKIPVGRGVTGRVAASGEPIVVGDAAAQADYIEDIVSRKSEICVPIFCDGELWGVIDSEDPRDNYYADHHLRFLKSVASLVGFKIQQIQLAEQLHNAEKTRAALFQIASISHVANDTKELLLLLQPVMAELMSVNIIKFGIYDKNSDCFSLRYSLDEGIAQAGLLNSPAEALSRSAARYLALRGQTLILNRTEFQHYIDQGYFNGRKHTPQLWMGIPFEVDENRVGIVVLESFSPTLRLSMRDTELLRDVGAGIGDALNHNSNVQACRKAEYTLAESEARLRGIIENAPFSIVLKDLEHRFLVVGSEYCRRHNVSPDDVLGKDESAIHPELYSKQIHEAEKSAIKSRKSIAFEALVPFSDGSEHSLLVTKFPILDDRGEVSGIGSISIDVTEQRRAEQQLLQAQKMETVGQLTGGIAHEFNNLLTVIIGGIEQAQEEASGEYQVSALEMAFRAAENGARLTQRLLAFSRTQFLAPKPTDINAVVLDTTKLISLALGSEIELEKILAGNLWYAMVDSCQLENALINIAMNSKHAMPMGGKLVFETKNVVLRDILVDEHNVIEAGDYVTITVSDAGSGMPDEIRRRVFEPFFTTKEVGKGSGLGLSMVLGFVSQSGGYVTVSSRLHEGTVVRLYLPRTDTRPRDEASKTDLHGLLKAGPEKILVVEDNSDVRMLLSRFLKNLGYDAVLVKDGLAAVVELERTDTPFDMLITDMVLPKGMDGRKIAARFLDLNGGGGVLYISGFTRDKSIRERRIDDRSDFLAKPFTQKDLALRIRRILDETTRLNTDKNRQ